MPVGDASPSSLPLHTPLMWNNVPSAVCQIVDIVRTSSAAKFRCAALQRNTTDKTVYRKANEAIASDACCKMVDDVSSSLTALQYLNATFLPDDRLAF